jgi:hypothetical protein
MKLSWPAVVVALCVGVGFYYAAFAVISISSSVLWGSRLWGLEFVVALLAAWAVIAWFGRLETRQRSNPRLDRGERAIWRLSYRQGNVLTLEQIQEFTLLDESTVLATLRRLETKGEAQLEPDGSWRLLEPNQVGPTPA